MEWRNEGTGSRGTEGQVPVSWRIEAVNVDFKDNIGIERDTNLSPVTPVPCHSFLRPVLKTR